MAIKNVKIIKIMNRTYSMFSNNYEITIVLKLVTQNKMN